MTSIATAKSLFDSRDQVEIKEGPYATPDNQVLASKMGGYRFWVLEAADFCGVKAPWIRIETYSLRSDGPNSLDGLNDYIDECTDLFVCYVYDAKLTILRANFTMGDIDYHIKADPKSGEPWSIDVVKRHLAIFMGMEEAYGPIELANRAAGTLSNAAHLKVQIESGPLVDLFANNDKRTKRVKNFARPFRFQALFNRPLKVKVTFGGPELDGMVALRRELYDEAVDGCTLPRFDHVHGDIIRHWGHKQPISNARFPGHSTVDEDTDGDVIEFLTLNGLMDPETWTLLAQPKGNAMVTDVPDDEDWDILCSIDCLGKETYGDGHWSMVCVDPQGAKKAWFDAQTVMNHPFMVSKPQAREIIDYEASKALTAIARGERNADILELASAEFSNRDSWDQRRYNETFRWAITIAAVHGISYLDSPWATIQNGKTWEDGLRLKPKDGKLPTELRLPLPCAKRAQVISVSTARLKQGLQIPEIAPRGYTWMESIGCMIVNDDDYNNIVFLTHGDPDHDDMFVMQQRTLTKGHVNVGEYFEKDEKIMLITRNPNHRGEYSLWHHQDVNDNSVWSYNTGQDREDRNDWTFPPITRNQWPTDILTAQGLFMLSAAGTPVQIATQETVIRPLPTDKDPTKSADDDRRYAWRWRKYVLKYILDMQTKGRLVDKTISGRLGLGKKLRGDPKGHLSTLQRVMKARAKTFRGDVKRLANDAKPREDLTALVTMFPEDIRDHAALMLRDARSVIAALNEANQFNPGQLDGNDIRNAQKVIFTPLDEMDTYRRSMVILSLWRSALTVKTSRGDISDQPLWGIPDVRDWLMEAVVLFGMSGQPYVTEEGTLEREWLQRFDHETSKWTMTCKKCARDMVVNNIKAVTRWQEIDQTCPDCAK